MKRYHKNAVTIVRYHPISKLFRYGHVVIHNRALAAIENVTKVQIPMIEKIPEDRVIIRSSQMGGG